jgi:predicted 2-oxoglutarate/Fe(II)-dependent dioxygenase YbiX
MRNPYEYIKIIPNAIPSEHLDILIKHGLDGKEDTSPALVGSGTVSEQSANLNYRYTHWIPIPEDMKENIQKAIMGLYQSELYSLYERDLIKFEPVQMLYYPVGGKYDEHNDAEDFVDGELKKVVDRDISILAYLNDDYEGGELEFTFLGLKIKPKKGTIIVFPSYFEYTHRVHPVTKGERFSLVTWIITNERIYSREK